MTVTKRGELYLGETKANVHSLSAEVKKRYPNAKAVYVRGDKETIWDPIAQVISSLGEAKYEVLMVTKPEDAADRRN